MHVKNLVDCGNAKITQHALKVTESSDIKVLKLDTIWKEEEVFQMNHPPSLGHVKGTNTVCLFISLMVCFLTTCIMTPEHQLLATHNPCPNQSMINSPDIWVDGVILIGPGSCPVDGLSVDPQPLAHLTQPLLIDGSDLPIGCGPDVHQQIAPQAR